MKKHRVILLLLSVYTLNIFCSLKKRPTPLQLHPELALDLSTVAKPVEMAQFAFSPEKDAELTQLRRDASRRFVAIMNQIAKFSWAPNLPDKPSFKVLCDQVAKYREQNLKLLEKNELLYDQGYDRRDNHFNSSMIPGLERIAQEYQFSASPIPVRIEQLMLLSDSESDLCVDCSDGSGSDVQPYPRPPELVRSINELDELEQLSL
jgi:hypothetical protein